MAVARLLVWCLLCLGAPFVLLREIQPKRTTKTNAKVDAAVTNQDVISVPKTIDALRAANADYIGIGNSMMFTRLGDTPERLNEITGKKFFFIYKNGSGSAVWYLTLKNVVAASGVKPKMVFFFIRDNDLTSPFFRTTGRYAAYLNSLRTPNEPVLDDVLDKPPIRQGPVGQLSRWLNEPGGVYSFPTWDEKIPRQLIDVAMDVGGMIPKAELRKTLSARFAVKHLRGDVGADLPAAGSGDGYAPDSYDDLNGNYQGAEEKSFLPAMMQLAKEQGFKLMFFRIKRRPDDKGTVASEPPELRPYAEHLKHWIEERGGLFFDESYDPAILLRVYGDGDHISNKNMGWYQDYFWKRMAPLFP